MPAGPKDSADKDTTREDMPATRVSWFSYATFLAAINGTNTAAKMPEASPQVK